MAANTPLAVYLNDHLAGSTAGRDQARKLAADTAGTPSGPFMAELLADIETDRATLEGLMDRLGVERQAVKQAGASATEKLGRLRFSDFVTGSRELSVLMEMETLSMGVHGKRAMWQSLREVAPAEPRLADVDLDTLLKRAQDQLDGLESHRLAAAAHAFS